MKQILLTSVLIFTFITACSPGPSRDTALEAEISKLIEADQTIAMNNFGQILVNVSSQKPFKMKNSKRKKLAESMAQAAINMHPESSVILIAFGRTQPEIQQIAYSWENKNGTLVQLK